MVQHLDDSRAVRGEEAVPERHEPAFPAAAALHAMQSGLLRLAGAVRRGGWARRLSGPTIDDMLFTLPERVF